MSVTTNYIISGNGITGSTANAVQALVSGAGNPARIVVAGDSFNSNGDNVDFPCVITKSGSINGVSIIQQQYRAAASSVARTLTYDPTANTLQFGDGASVVLTRSGLLIIPTATPDTGVAVSVRIPELTNSVQTVTVTSQTTRPDPGRTMLSVVNWAAARTKQRYEFLNLSGGGQTLNSGASIVAYALATYNFGAIGIFLGINDIDQAIAIGTTVAGALAEMQRRWEACFAPALATGKPVLTSYLSPYYGTQTATHLAVADAFNQWLSTRNRTAANLKVLNLWASMVNPDPSATTGRTGYVQASDNLHPLPPAAQYAGFALGDAVDTIGLPAAADPFIGFAQAPASATHPGGNIITNPWQFGSAGTAGGFGAVSNSWVLTNGATALSAIAATKVARTDGVAGEWQRMTVSSAANLAFFSFAPTVVASMLPSAGQMVQLMLEVVVNGDMLCPDIRVQMGSSLGTSPFLRAMNVDNSGAVAMPYQSYSIVLATASFPWPSDAVAYSNLLVNAFARDVTAGATVDIGRVGFRKAV